MTVKTVSVARGLATLREPAPPALAAAVLDRLELGDRYVELPGPIGPLFVAFGARGISLVERVELVRDAGTFEEQFSATFGRPIRRVARAPRAVERAIEARIWGRQRAVRPPLDLSELPEFERQVLEKTLEIPRGEVRPYAWVAAELGRPRAVRAVGNALARNPVPFVVPCHRVVRSDGTIGRYGAGGPQAKRELLAFEGLDVDALEQLPAAGVRFIGSDATGIYCYPSCRNARRIASAHRVPFHTAGESRRAGYRPCLVCRPVDPPTRAAA